mmetsp:Transcript_38132/g.59473  ORF Transcript_38132/g.59473 Transcript_38132/m.59473 type:complete len:83 (+) Transcript_38132:3-251(+)
MVFALLSAVSRGSEGLGGCSAGVAASGLPQYALSNLCDVSSVPQSLLDSEKSHDTADLFPGLQPRGLGAPGAVPSSVSKLVK